MYFRMKFALFFRLFDSWYIIKYLLTETSGKQYVLWTLDCRCFPRLRLGKHRQSRVHKTYCFPPSQSISVKYDIDIEETKLSSEIWHIRIHLTCAARCAEHCASVRKVVGSIPTLVDQAYFPVCRCGRTETQISITNIMIKCFIFTSALT